MNRAELIIEKFVTAVKKPIGIVDIYVNPKRQEFDSIESNAIRFIADKKEKKVYVWDATKMVHMDAAKTLKLKDYLIWYTNHKIGKDVRYLIGDAGKFVKDYTNTGSHILISAFFSIKEKKKHLGKPLEEISKDYINSILSENWSWVDRYIKGTSKMINHLNKEMKDLE